MSKRTVLFWFFLLIFTQQLSAEYIWEPLTFPGLSEPIRQMTFIPPQTFYVWTPSGMKKSLDGGGSWKDMDIKLPLFPNGQPRPLKYISIARTDPKVIYAGGGGFYRSVDGGVTWENITPDFGEMPKIYTGFPILGPIVVSPYDANHVVLYWNGPILSGGFKFSKNGGKEWSDLSIGGSDLFGFFVHPLTGALYFRYSFAATSAIYKLDFRVNRVVKVYSNADVMVGYGFSSGDSELLYFVYRSTMGKQQPIYLKTSRGREWLLRETQEEQPGSIAFHSETGTFFLAVYPNWFAYSAGGPMQVLLTKDMGATWTECGQMPGEAQLFFLSDGNTLYAQSKEMIYQLQNLTSVSPRGRVTMTWGKLKAGR